MKAIDDPDQSVEIPAADPVGSERAQGVKRAFLNAHPMVAPATVTVIQAQSDWCISLDDGNVFIARIISPRLIEMAKVDPADHTIALEKFIPLVIPFVPSPAPSPEPLQAIRRDLVRLHELLERDDGALLKDLKQVEDEATEIKRIMDLCPLDGTNRIGERISPESNLRVIVGTLQQRVGLLTTLKATVAESEQVLATIAPTLSQARQVVVAPQSPLGDLQPLGHLDAFAQERVSQQERLLNRCEELRQALRAAVATCTAHLPRFEAQIAIYRRAVQRAVPEILISEYQYWLTRWEAEGRARRMRLATIEAEAQINVITWPDNPLEAPKLG